MATPSLIPIQGAVEGPLDESILRRLILHANATPGTIYGKQGKANLLDRLRGYNQAARASPWVVLMDLDQDAECAPPFLSAHLPDPMPQMCCRAAVRAVESWLIADRERLARFLDVPESRIPLNPEALPNPKLTMVELARRSRRRDVREDMVPRPEGGRKVGPAYASRLIEFVEDRKSGWRPEIAAKHSDSLSRCLRWLRRLTPAPQRITFVSSK